MTEEKCILTEKRENDRHRCVNLKHKMCVWSVCVECACKLYLYLRVGILILITADPTGRVVVLVHYVGQGPGRF